MNYDIIVIGGGHAGIEASLAAAKMGAKTLLITILAEQIGAASCNPAIGGLAKGHLVKGRRRKRFYNRSNLLEQRASQFKKNFYALAKSRFLGNERLHFFILFRPFLVHVMLRYKYSFHHKLRKVFSYASFSELHFRSAFPAEIIHVLYPVCL